MSKLAANIGFQIIAVETRQTDQFIAARMARVRFLEERNMRIAQPAGINFGNSIPQPLSARFRPQDAAGWIETFAESLAGYARQ
jgi:hypothetical protein